MSALSRKSKGEVKHEYVPTWIISYVIVSYQAIIPQVSGFQVLTCWVGGFLPLPEDENMADIRFVCS